MSPLTFATWATQRQPSPPVDTAAEQPSVLDDLAAARAVSGDVYAALLARETVGVEKYGTRLRTGNGRDTALDYAQEQLDGTVYAWQSGMQARGWRPVVWRLLARLGALCARVAWLLREEPTSPPHDACHPGGSPSALG